MEHSFILVCVEKIPDTRGIYNFMQTAAAPDFFCLMSGEGCPQKSSDAVQDREASNNPCSPVIAAFKGNYNWM